MQIQLEAQPYASIQADALVAYIFDKDDKVEGIIADLNQTINDRLAQLAANGEISG
jgi:hypothetical protein